MDPESSWNIFTKILIFYIDKFVPKIAVKNENKPPWFDADCFQKCKEKDKLHRKFKANKSISNELKFKRCRKEFKDLIKTKMRTNLCDPQRNLLTKKFWSHVKSKSKSPRIPEVMYYKGKCSSNPLDKANMFNHFFFQQFSAESLYDVDIDFTDDEKFNIDFNPNTIKSFLQNIDINKAQGPDNLNGAIFKNCSDTLCLPLSIIFKLIYNTGLIPSQWKTANVVPVHKKDDSNNICNYRPISLTCICSKIMERVIYAELLKHTLHLIDDRQHGFLHNRSCATNMINLIDSLSTAVLNNTATDIIYFDFAKAFDSVNHDLILKKLKNFYGIDGRMLKFIRSYLQDRKQRVVLDNHISDEVKVLSGVPQGSILGPLLFVLFINDIYANINADTNIELYADDTKIWRQINSNNDCEILQDRYKFTL